MKTNISRGVYCLSIGVYCLSILNPQIKDVLQTWDTYSNYLFIEIKLPCFKKFSLTFLLVINDMTLD